MAILIALLLVLFSVGVVVYPFLNARRPDLSPIPSSLQGLAERRLAIYTDVQTLELEHELGNVEDEDYHRRLKSYVVAAASTLRAEENAQAVLEKLDRRVEEEVLLSRASRRGGQGDASCPTCGQLLSPGAKTCSHCGIPGIKGGPEVEYGDEV